VNAAAERGGGYVLVLGLFTRGVRGRGVLRTTSPRGGSRKSEGQRSSVARQSWASKTYSSRSSTLPHFS
jgi:hypothetical protein